MILAPRGWAHECGGWRLSALGMSVGIAAALIAALGTHMVVTALLLGWSGVGLGPRAGRPDAPAPIVRWLRAGTVTRRGAQVAVAQCAAAFLSGVAAWMLFGTVTVSIVVAACGWVAPVAARRRAQRARLDAALDAWPRLIEEMRLASVTMGRSVPQALFDAGRRAPVEMQAAFDAAHREWVLSSDFEATLCVLSAQLADPTADAVAETLLVAHEVGGTDIDGRLQALAEDRSQDVQGRKDARARQAGVRFARWFVVIVPVGMALVGLSIGDGRASYTTVAGQAAVMVALAIIVGCWWWASRLLRLPAEPRVLAASLTASARPHARLAR